VSDRNQRWMCYIGVFLITLATLMMEILNTRILSVMAWYHLAFFVISVVMFGMTVGAIIIHLAPGFFTDDNLRMRLGQSALAFAVTTALTHLVTVSLPIMQLASIRDVIVLFVLSLNLAIPFVFSGICVALALTRSPFPIGRMYSFDLVGAACGCLLVIFLMTSTDAHSAVFITAAFGSLAAAFFFTASNAKSYRDASLLSALIFLLVALLNSMTYHGIRPVVVKDNFENQNNILYEGWNSYSRITMFKPVSIHQNPPVWRSFLVIDGLAGTSMYLFDGDINKKAFFLSRVNHVAHHLREKAEIGIIGVGGGQDVLAAVAAGAKRIIGIEMNPIFVQLLEKDFRSFANLATRPEVTLVNDEARTWLTTSSESFDILQMSLIDTWAATGAGAFTLSENGLYTIESWRIFLARLKPQGIFTVSRWFNPNQVNETTRLVSLAVAALLDSGVREPQNCLILLSAGPLSTLLVSKSPFSAQDLQRIKDICSKFSFTPILIPGDPAGSALLGEIWQATSVSHLAALSAPLSIDITPPTDEKPFFFNLLKFSAIAKTWEYTRNSGDFSKGVINGNMTATLTLIAIFAITTLLAVVVLLLPVWLRRSFAGIDRVALFSGTLYFSTIGLGFMFAEIGFLQRFSILLGNPVYSLSVVLASLIFFTGIGSLISESIPQTRRGTWLLRLGVALALLMVVFLFFIPLFCEALAGKALAVRILSTVFLIMPIAMSMGVFFPLGLSLFSRACGAKPLPWFFAINGAMGVFASTAAILVSITMGIRATYGLAAISYFLAAIAVLIVEQLNRKAIRM
jgi:spermidine synthase